MKDTMIKALNDSKVEYTSGPYRTNDAWVQCGNMFAYVLNDCILVGPHGSDFMALTECKTVAHALSILTK